MPYSWFFKVLKFREWPIFIFYDFIFPNGSAKLEIIWGNYFFEGLNFMNDQHPQNLQNYILQKTNYIVDTRLGHH